MPVCLFPNLFPNLFPRRSGAGNTPRSVVGTVPRTLAHAAVAVARQARTLGNQPSSGTPSLSRCASRSRRRDLTSPSLIVRTLPSTSTRQAPRYCEPIMPTDSRAPLISSRLTRGRLFVTARIRTDSDLFIGRSPSLVDRWVWELWEIGATAAIRDFGASLPVPNANWPSYAKPTHVFGHSSAHLRLGLPDFTRNRRSEGVRRKVNMLIRDDTFRNRLCPVFRHGKIACS